MSTTAVLVCGQQQQEQEQDNPETTLPPLLLVRPNLEPHATGADLKRDVCALLGVPTAASGARAFFDGQPLADNDRVANAGVPTSPRALRVAGESNGCNPASGAALRAAGADERVYPCGWTQGGRLSARCYLRKRDRAWPPEREAESVGAWPLWLLVLAALALRFGLGV